MVLGAALAKNRIDIGKAIMSPQVKPDIKPFYEAIGAALKARGSISDDFERDPAYKECRYVVRMCQRMAEMISRPDVGLIEVMRVERGASGHCDYQRKFAMYCRELQVGRSYIQAAA
jgi:hypothetical protein